MDKQRGEEILSSGLRAAEKHMSKRPLWTDYPHDFHKLYSWLEDATFDLYEAVELKQFQHMCEAAGKIITIVSEMTELANNHALVQKALKEKTNEVSDS